MSSRNPDNSSAVMIALFSATMLLCLVGALALLPSHPGYRWLGMVLAGLLVAMPFLFRAAHRSRIRHAVHETGGTVIYIRCLPFWKPDSLLGRSGRIHKVRYCDIAGVEHEAVCRSGFLGGVEWITDHFVGSWPRHQ